MHEVLTPILGNRWKFAGRRPNQIGQYFRTFVLIYAMTAASVASAADTSVLYRFSGTISSAEQVDSFVLDIAPDDVDLTASGSISLGISMRALGSGDLNPGLIEVEALPGGAVIDYGPQKPNTSGSSNSLSIVSVTAGSYNISMMGQNESSGDYEVVVYLLGDVNGDLTVDENDLDSIGQAYKAKIGSEEYLAEFDLDRNGIINNGDLRRATKNLGASIRSFDLENSLDAPIPPGSLFIVGHQEGMFFPLENGLTIKLANAEFSQELSELALMINGVKVQSENLVLLPNELQVLDGLVDGKNEIDFQGYDEFGRNLYLQKTLWAGSTTLFIDLISEDGSPFSDSTNVKVRLSDDPSIQNMKQVIGGNVEFEDVPLRTVLVDAESGNYTGSSTNAVIPGVPVVITMNTLGEPSEVDNNEFDQGTDGWEVGDAPVEIVPHIEGFPAPATASSSLTSISTEQSQSLQTIERGPPPMTPFRLIKNKSKQKLANSSIQSASTIQAVVANNDLSLSTSGQGPQSISRTFNVPSGTTTVRLRYRFITSEVPGGFFGSVYNDGFSVSIKGEGKTANFSSSMNALGLDAFDYGSGATAWREIDLPLSGSGGTIQVNARVTNVADGLFDSRIVLDLVQVVNGKVQPSGVSWDNSAGGIKVSYKVLNETLTAQESIKIFWASGSSYSNRIGASVSTIQVPSGKAPGDYSGNVSGSLLKAKPSTATRLIAVGSSNMTASVSDVSVSYGSNAKKSDVSSAMLDIIGDGQRVAGQSKATITSTAREATDQARAMFNNLVKTDDIEANITAQKKLYGSNGDKVIDVFESETEGLTRAQILAIATTVKAEMLAKINELGCANVSKHCADPNDVSVVDVARSAFGASARTKFIGEAQPRCSRFFDEPKNNAMHLEKNK